MVAVVKLILKLLVLVSSAVISFFAISPYEFYPAAEDYDLPVYQILIPGLVFTIFIVTVRYTHLIIKELFIACFVSLITYFVLFIISMSSWGLAVPFCGAFGGIIIKNIFFKRSSLSNFSSLGIIFTVVGFISSGIGLVLFFVLKLHPPGYGMGLIIVLWQLSIGGLVICQKRLTPNDA